jgi:putative SOS response-associated peptidase YedK
MCGYLRRHIDPKDLKEFLKLIGMPQLELPLPEDGLAQHFYPAWGAVPEKQIKGLIVLEDGHPKVVDATWWYACDELGDTLRPDMKRQTLNARRLHLDIWQEPLRQRRGIAIATAIGEAIGPKGKEKRFFVEGERPILLGCLYDRFQNGKYSCAVITRNAHPRFMDYHDDAFPLMLPHDPNFLKLWLSDTHPNDPAIAELLKQPKIFTHLTVTPVKTYKDAVPRGEPVLVHADEWVTTS